MYQKKNAGFTLIELLVVVLIVGILAAVALPQYQAAVDKTRFATAMYAVRALKEAQEQYYLANGSYSRDIRDLTHALPGGCQVSGNFFADCAKISLVIDDMDYVYGRPAQGLSNAYLVWLDRSSAPGRVDCYAYNESGERGRRLCKNLGGVRDGAADGAQCSGSCTIYRIY